MSLRDDIVSLARSQVGTRESSQWKTGEVLSSDRYESNNIRDTATSLVGQTSGKLSNLSIHDFFDMDYFKINLGSTGTSSSYVLADFSDAAGDLDMYLYNSSGTIVRSSTSVTDDERISLSGLNAGTYYIMVYGCSGATNDYSLQWNTSADTLVSIADRYESNNIRDTATSLVGRSSGTLNNLSIHDFFDMDYFKINLGSTGTSSSYVLADFSDAAGDLDMYLYNSSGTIVRSSTSVTDDERISLSGLNAGTYYVMVYGCSGATNDYSLQWNTGSGGLSPDSYESNNSRATATSLVGQTSGTRSNLSIHNSSDVDYFRINLGNTGTSSSYVLADFSDAAGDLDMYLYNSSGTIVRSSTSVTDDERISLSGLNAGTYYVKVDGYGSDTNTYSLQWNTVNGLTSDRYESNNTHSTATSLVGQTSGTRSNLTIHNSSDVDYFEINLGSTGTSSNYVLADFSHAAGDLDMWLYNSSSGQRVGYSTSETDDERISLSGLTAGTYYVKVSGATRDQTNNYSLQWNTVPGSPTPDRYESNNTRSTATSLIGQTSGTLSNLNIHNNSDVDYFKINLGRAGSSDNYILADFSDAAGNLDMYLYNSSGNAVRSSTSVTDDERISLSGLNAGTYYVKVDGYGSDTNTYSLQWNTVPGGLSPDSYESNNSRGTATSLVGQTSGTRSNLTIHNSSDVDYFKISLGGTGTSNNFVLADFSDAAGDLDMYLYNSSGSLLRSASTSTDDERISLSGLSAGTYYVEIDGYNGNTNTYSLQWNTEPVRYGLSPDSYESNNSRGTATSLVGQTSGTRSNLTIHNSSDVDYFKINLGSTGTSNNFVLADFSDAAGNLDMYLYNSSGSLVRSSTSVTDDERISLSGLNAGTYYVKVDGYGSDTNTYSLQWNTVPGGLSPDSYESNNSRGTATSLVGQTSGTRSNLTIHNSSDVDYFKINLGSTGTSNNYVLTDFSDAAGNLDMYLYNSSGSLLRSASTSTDDERISLSGLNAGTYYVKVDGYGSDTNTYSLQWNTVPVTYGLSPDRYESNDSLDTATSLVGQTSGTLNNLSIHARADTDYFKINLGRTGTSSNYVLADFSNDEGGDLDMYLYDSSGSLVDSSKGITDGERISLSGLDAGTYYVKVSSFLVGTNTYSLQWNTGSAATVSGISLMGVEEDSIDGQFGIA